MHNKARTSLSSPLGLWSSLVPIRNDTWSFYPAVSKVFRFIAFTLYSLKVFLLNWNGELCRLSAKKISIKVIWSIQTWKWKNRDLVPDMSWKTELEKNIRPATLVWFLLGHKQWKAVVLWEVFNLVVITCQIKGLRR